MLYCEEGEVKLELNNVARHLQANDLLISLPNTIIGQVMASPNHKVKVFCFSNRFIQRLTQTQKYSWKSICYIQENPIKHFGENRNETFHQYLKLIEDKIQTPPDKYQKEILLHIASAFMARWWLKPPESPLKRKARIPHSCQTTRLHLQAIHGSADSRQWQTSYTDLLCRPILLFTEVPVAHRQANQRENALTLIHENAIEHIIPELRHSNKVLRKFLWILNSPMCRFCTICKKILRNDTYGISQQQSREK